MQQHQADSIQGVEVIDIPAVVALEQVDPELPDQVQGQMLVEVLQRVSMGHHHQVSLYVLIFFRCGTGFGI